MHDVGAVGDQQHLDRRKGLRDETRIARELDGQHEMRLVPVEAASHARERLGREEDACGQPSREEALAGTDERRLREHAVDDDLELRLPPGLHVRAEALEAPRALEHVAAALEHDAARRGELRASPGALEERHAERGFERLHRVAHGGRRAVQVLRGGGEAPEAIDRLEDFELVEGEAKGHARASLADLQ